jgi:hypothetical protein
MATLYTAAASVLRHCLSPSPQARCSSLRARCDATVLRHCLSPSPPRKRGSTHRLDPRFRGNDSRLVRLKHLEGYAGAAP